MTDDPNRADHRPAPAFPPPREHDPYREPERVIAVPAAPHAAPVVATLAEEPGARPIDSRALANAGLLSAEECAARDAKEDAARFKRTTRRVVAMCAVAAITLVLVLVGVAIAPQSPRLVAFVVGVTSLLLLGVIARKSDVG
jgi:hypothetical protein